MEFHPRMHPLRRDMLVNRTDIHRPAPYEYLSYGFSNMSAGIIRLFVEACENLRVSTRVTQTRRGLFQVRINTRPSVGLLLET